MKDFTIHGETKVQETNIDSLVRQGLSTAQYYEIKNLTLVMITPRINGELSYNGLDMARKLLSKEPTLMIGLISFETEDSLRRSDDFSFLMCFPNVSFIGLYDIRNHFWSFYQNLVEDSTRMGDEDSAAIYRYLFFKAEADSLKEDESIRGRDESIKRGRRMGLMGHDSDVINQINNLDLITNSYFNNKSLDIVLVDLDVFFENDILSLRKKRQVEKTVKEMYGFEKNIFIVSDKYFNREILRDGKIFFPIVYYNELKGARVKTLIKAKDKVTNDLLKFEVIEEL